MPRVSLLAGTRKGAFVLESDADRDEWTVHGPHLAGWKIADLYYDRPAERLYAAVGHFVYGSTVQWSDDLGKNWEQAAESPAYPEESDRELNQVWTIVPSPHDPDTLYAGVDEAGLFVSRDRGDTWSAVSGLNDHGTRDQWFPGKGGLCLHSILVDPDDPDRMWVGISAVGVFRTVDGGDTWTLQNDGLELVDQDLAEGPVGSCVHRVVLDPTDPDRLFQQNHRGVFRSADGADTWERIDEGLPSTFGFPMVVHPSDPGTLYTVPLESDERRMAIDGRPAVYRSSDAGTSWERIVTGLPGRAWVTVLRQAMAVDTLDPAGVYVGTTGGDVYASNDAGDSWTPIDCRLPRIFSLNAVVLE